MEYRRSVVFFFFFWGGDGSWVALLFLESFHGMIFLILYWALRNNHICERFLNYIDVFFLGDEGWGMGVGYFGLQTLTKFAAAKSIFEMRAWNT